MCGFGDGGSAPTTTIEPLEDAVDEAERFIRNNDSLHARLDRVARLIENFETPFGMELLSSVHWVAIHGLAGQTARTAQDAAILLRRWNARKARTFREDHAAVAWDRLVEEGWIQSGESAA